MNPKGYGKVLDESVIEVNDTVKGTIEKFRQMRGNSYEEDCNEATLEFSCSKKGIIEVSNPASRHDFGRSAFVVGEVTEHNGKTVVKMYSIYSRFTAVSKAIKSILLVSFLAIYFLVSFLQFGEITPKALYVVLLGVPFFFFCFNQDRNEVIYKTEDLEKMKQMVIKRVKAVNNWDK